MQKHKQSLALLIVFCTTLFSSATSASWFSDQSFFYGLGLGYELYGFKPGYGDGFMPNDSLGYDLFLGTEHPSKIGFELGTTFTPSRSKTSGLAAGDKFPGTSVPLAPGTWETWEPSFHSFAVYAGINKYFVIPEHCKWQVYGFLGVSATYIRAIANFLADDLPIPPSPLEVALAQNTFDDAKIIPVLKLGIEYNFNKIFACKIYYFWKGTAAFNNLKSWEYPESASELRMKNTNAFYFGLNLYV